MASVNLGALSYAIEIDTKTGQASVKKLSKDVKDLDNTMGGPSGAMGLAKSLSVTAGKFLAAYKAVQIFTKFISDSVDASNEMIKAMTGLNSIATAFGVDAGDAQKAAKELAEDGLMSVSDAAAALKNLLARGFGLDESIKLMNAFKDSAAFNRQAALGFGQAIRGATEGLKNENSILVDNAGITRNVSKMWEDHAKVLGKGARSLSDVEKRQAELNGIMKESAAFMGDAAKAADTYAGKTDALGTSFFNLKVKIGDFITQSTTTTFWVDAISASFDVLAGLVEDVRKGFSYLTTVVMGYLAAKSNGMGIIDSWNFATREAKEEINGLNDELGKKAPESAKKFEQAITQNVVKPIEKLGDKADDLIVKFRLLMSFGTDESVKPFELKQKFKSPGEVTAPPLSVDEQIAAAKKEKDDRESAAMGLLGGGDVEGAVFSGIGTAIATAAGAPMAGEFVGSLLKLIVDGTLLDELANVLMKLISSPERIQAMMIRWWNVFLPEFIRQLPKFIAAFIAALPAIQLAIMLSMPQMALAFILAIVDLLSPTFWKQQFTRAWRSLEEVAFPSLSEMWEELAALFGEGAGKALLTWADDFGKKVSENLSFDQSGGGIGGVDTGDMLGTALMMNPITAPAAIAGNVGGAKEKFHSVTGGIF